VMKLRGVACFVSSLAAGEKGKRAQLKRRVGSSPIHQRFDCVHDALKVVVIMLIAAST
jgi:hypothetical protein